MSETEKPFSVSDRRHFTPEGQARDEEAQPVSTPGAESPAEPASPAAAEADPHISDAPRAGGPVDFRQFLLSLGAQAATFLSATAPDKPAERAAALEGARSVIGILEMLREKTEGRRTPEEDQILDGLLFELRMAFVERSRAGQP
jgi:hypothetical protein